MWKNINYTLRTWGKQMMVEVSLTIGRSWVLLPSSNWRGDFGLLTAWFYRQCSLFCHTSLFCDGVITIWVPGSFKTGKEGRKKWAQCPGTLRLVGTEEKNSVWCLGPSRPDEERKGDWYMTSVVTENGHLPFELALVKLAILWGVKNRDCPLQTCIEEVFVSECVGVLPSAFLHSFLPSHT